MESILSSPWKKVHQEKCLLKTFFIVSRPCFVDRRFVKSNQKNNFKLLSSSKWFTLNIHFDFFEVKKWIFFPKKIRENLSFLFLRQIYGIKNSYSTFSKLSQSKIYAYTFHDLFFNLVITLNEYFYIFFKKLN